MNERERIDDKRWQYFRKQKIGPIELPVLLLINTRLLLRALSSPWKFGRQTCKEISKGPLEIRCALNASLFCWERGGWALAQVKSFFCAFEAFSRRIL